MEREQATPHIPGPELAETRLRFFRDLTTAERMKVYAVFGIPDEALAEITSHAVEHVIFKRLFGEALAARSVPEGLAETVAVLRSAAKVPAMKESGHSVIHSSWLVKAADALAASPPGADNAQVAPGDALEWADPDKNCSICKGNPYWGKTLSSWTRCECVRRKSPDVVAHFEALRASLEKDAQVAPAPVVSVKTMKLSDGRADYYVSVAVGDREVTPHMFRIKGRAEFEVANWQWLFEQGPKPEIMDWLDRTADPDERATPAAQVAPPEPAEGEAVAWPGEREQTLLTKLAGAVFANREAVSAGHEMAEQIAAECGPLLEALGLSDEGDGWGFSDESVAALHASPDREAATREAVIEALRECVAILPHYRLMGRTTSDDEALDAVLERARGVLGIEDSTASEGTGK
jgi:hypothetical protein